jgi:acyl-CoA synthetase (AMP-forming)/AMP-acid ligase II
MAAQRTATFPPVTRQETTLDLSRMYAVSQPDKPAVIDDRGQGDVRTLSFAALDDQATRLAGVLAGRGVAAGDKVAWCGQNSLGIVLFLTAARQLGVTAVPVH